MLSTWDRAFLHAFVMVIFPFLGISYSQLFFSCQLPDLHPFDNSPRHSTDAVGHARDYITHFVGGKCEFIFNSLVSYYLYHDHLHAFFEACASPERSGLERAEWTHYDQRS